MLMAPPRQPEGQCCFSLTKCPFSEVKVLHYLCSFSLMVAWRVGVMSWSVSLCLLVVGRNFPLSQVLRDRRGFQCVFYFLHEFSRCSGV